MTVEPWMVRWNGQAKEHTRLGRTSYLVGASQPGLNPEPEPDPGTDPPPPPPPPLPPAGRSLYAGHIPNRVMLGFSAPDDGNAQWAFPGWSEARQILNRNVYVKRDFTGSTNAGTWLGWITATHRDCMTKQPGQPLYPVLSVKCSSYTQLTSGAFDATWIQIREYAKTRRTSGPLGTPQPFALTFDHEPDGNPGGTLLQWGRGQRRMSNFFSGWQTDPITGAKISGSYNPANDVSDIMAWHCIPNGHWIGPKQRNDAKLLDALPKVLVDDFAENRSILVPDIYDPSPQNKDTVADPNRTTAPYEYAANADRTHRKAEAWFEWRRAMGSGGGALGFGEFSATEAAEIDRVWAVLRANRDLCGFASHFSSPQNSRWDWRLIPANYPAGQFPDVFKSGVFTLRDYGGSLMSSQRLTSMRVAIDQSVSAQYTTAA